LIETLLVTISLESFVVIAYGFWREKPVLPILLTSLWINFFTQSLLWLGLNLFFRDYLVALAIAEVLIWGMESSLLYSVSANQLRLKEAILLSLSMNLVSFVIGWFLPV
jgi:hypothetical protein